MDAAQAQPIRPSRCLPSRVPTPSCLRAAASRRVFGDT